MNLSESHRQRLQKLAGIKVSEVFSHDKYPHNIVMIRSKIDKSFIWDIYYRTDNNKIFKVENSGKQRDVFADKPWFNFILNFSTGKTIDFDYLRDSLSKFPELYVKDIM